MLNSIIRFSVRNKLIVGLLTLTLFAWGIYNLSGLPIDAVPDITNNQVQVITVSPNFAAEEVERFITFPVEQVMATIPSIHEIRSISRFGLSVVTIVFSDETDVYWARQQVHERLAQAQEEIPPDMGKPTLAPVTTGLGEIYQYILRTEKGYEKEFSPVQLRTLQDWIVRRQLLGTPGVADVSSFGGYLRQYEVAIDPGVLQSMSISISDIIQSLEKNNSNTGGTYIEKGPTAWFIRSEGVITGFEEIKNIVVKNQPNGTPVRIRDIAEVGEGHAVRFGAMTRNDEGEVVGGIVMMLKGENSGKVISNVKERVARIQTMLPKGVIIEPFLDRKKLVDNAIHTVGKNLIEGALIVIFVLVLLLGNLRAGLIVASVIPLSMLFAVSLMRIFGVSGNLMSLGAIDFGLIVDGAVIIVEAVLHHIMSGNTIRKLSVSEMNEEVEHSAGRMMNSAAFGQIIILIVYVPILTLTGVEGKMFRPMAQTVAFAILGAMLLSLTYVPMITALFMTRKTGYRETFSDKLIGWVRKLYQPSLQFALRFRKLIVSASVLALVFAVLLFTRLGGEFIPTLDEGDFAVESRTLTGASLDHTVRNVQLAADILKKKFPEVKEVVGKIGTSEIPTDPMPIESGDMIIVLKDKSEWTSAHTREELADTMSKALSAIPGMSFGFQQPIQMRFNELMTGARQDIVIKVYGEDLEKLSQYANTIGSIASGVEGAEDVFIEQMTGQPQLLVKPDRDKLARYGITVDDVNQVIQAGFAGAQVGEVLEGERRFGLVVRLKSAERKNAGDLGKLFVVTAEGMKIPLSELAEIRFKEGPNQIQRDDTKRRIVIGFNVRNRDIESIMAELKAKINKQVRFETGYYITYGGTFKNLEEARNRLLIAVPVAMLLIFILLFFTFNSMAQALLIFSAIPLSAIGGILALALRGMPFSISAGVGFIALFGVAVLNGIVLIAEFNRLRAEGLEDLQEVVRQGTHTRLRPVIMTALVASLGFLPMAISGSSGAEVQRPLATVVIGGLVSATLLTLLVLPVLYVIFSAGKKRGTATQKALLAFLVASLGYYPATAQTPIKMEDAVNLALEKSPALRSALYKEKAAQADRKAALDLGMTDFSYLGGQFNSYRFDHNLTVSQRISSPFLISAERQKARAGEMRAFQNAEFTREGLRQQVRSEWTALLFLKEQEKILYLADSIMQSIALIQKKRFEAGDAGISEWTAAENHALERRLDLDKIRSEIVTATQLLQLRLGLDQSPVMADEAFIPLELPLENGPPNPAEIKLAKAELEFAREAENVARKGFFPELSAGLFAQTLTGPQLVNGTEINYGYDKRFLGLNAGLSFPLIFNAQAAKAESAKYQVLSASQDLSQKSMETDADYFATLEKIRYWQNEISVLESTALPRNSGILRRSAEALRNGEIGYYEFQLSANSALSLQLRKAQAVYMFNMAVIHLKYLMGEPSNQN